MTQESLVEYFRDLKRRRGIVQAHLARKLELNRMQFNDRVFGRYGAQFTPEQVQLIEAETGEPLPIEAVRS